MANPAEGNGFIRLALKYVIYEDPITHRPVVSHEQALTNLRVINSIWHQCGIGFELEDFVVLDVADRNLNFGIGNYPELDDVRGEFADESTLLIVTTGAWNRKGSLGDSPANAWTSMPGSAPYGAVLERSVGAFSNIVAHELGHYLGLMHSDNRGDLMNPIIYNSSISLTADQCKLARSAASQYWQKMMR
jgi:hypothetical protein